MTDHKPPAAQAQSYLIPQAAMAHMSQGKTYPLSQFAVTEPPVLTPLEEIAKQQRIANLLVYATVAHHGSHKHNYALQLAEEGLGL